MSNARTVYQLRAEGDSLNGWRFKMRSKAIFLDRQAAERHIAEFKDRCCDETFFECADPATLRITVEELDLYD